MTETIPAFATANPDLGTDWTPETTLELDGLLEDRQLEGRAHLRASDRLWRLKDRPDILERGGIRRVARRAPFRMSPGLVSMRLTVAEFLIVPLGLDTVLREFSVEGRVAYYAAVHARRMLKRNDPAMWTPDEAAMHCVRTFRLFDRDEASAFHEREQLEANETDLNPRTPVLLTASADTGVVETVRDGVERFIGVASGVLSGSGNRNANRRDASLERLGEFLRGADDLTLEAIAVAADRNVYDLAGIVRIGLDLLDRRNP